MKSKVFFFILYLLVTITSFGQDLKKDEIIKHKIKTVTAIDTDGKVKSIEFFDENGDIVKSGSIDDNNKFK